MSDKQTAVTKKFEKVTEPVFSMNGFEHAQRVAIMLSKSELIPKEYKGNIQNTMIALEIATRIGASPLMVMQNLYIVHGKPSWSSTFIISAINACGRFSPLRFEVWQDEKNGMSCKAWTTEKETKERIEGPTITMKMAEAEGWVSKNGSKWKTMPDLMIRYRAAAFFGRLYAPEILMGIQTNEEILDVYADVVPSQEAQEDKEGERVRLMIGDAQTVDELKAVEPHLKEGQLDLYTVKMDELKAKQ